MSNEDAMESIGTVTQLILFFFHVASSLYIVMCLYIINATQYANETAVGTLTVTTM